MKTESLPTQDSDAAGSTGARSEQTLIHHNSELSQHLKEYLVAQLQDKNGGQPNQAPAGFWHQAPQAPSSDYHLPPADKVVYVKLSVGETTFHVPANTTFDTIRVVGHDLVLVQKDGTAIVLEDAGDKIPNIEIGDVDVPKVALEAAFTANGIQAAEGPSGNPAPSSGGNFEDARAATLGNGRGVTGLLGAEGFNFNGTSIHYPPPPLPEIKVNTNAEPTLTLSETHLTAGTNGVNGSDPDASLTTISADFSVDFTPTPDVNGGVVTYALSIHGGNGTASGFIDSQTGLPDVLVQNGNTIEGHVGNANGALAFTISINPNTGVVTFTEDRAVFETQTGTNPSANIATMSANVVTLTATITDGLGHEASASLDLGKQISLTDDAPSIVSNAATVPGLTLSETDLTAGTNGVNGTSPNAALTTITGHFAGDFTDTSGADGLKSTTYALSIAGGNGTASGLVDSQSGQADVLVQNGNTIEGHVGSATGALAFTITLDPATGDVTFTEDRAVQNNNTGSTGVSLAAGAVSLTQTITDNDGSTASATIDLGPKLSITDDTPVITLTGATESTLTVHEADLQASTNGVAGTIADGATSASANFSTAFSDNFGADAAAKTGSVSYALLIGDNGATGLTDTQSGTAVTLIQNGATEIDGKDANGDLVFVIKVDSSGDVTFTLDRSVENNSGPVTLSAGAVSLQQTITDRDGSTASNSIDISGKLSITDDTPVITLTGTKESTLTVHEADLQASTNGVNGTTADGATSSSADFSTAFSDNFGADGAAKTDSVSYALLVGNNGATGLIDTQSGTAVTLDQVSSTEIDGKDANGDLVFVIKVDASGDVTFTLDRSVENNSGPVTLPTGAVTLQQTITDGDGSTASNSVDISNQFSITDDTPVITLTGAKEPTLTVSESNLTFLTNDVNGTDPDLKLTHISGNFSGAFSDNFGADGEAKSGAVAYSLSYASKSSGLTDTQTGDAVLMKMVGSNEIEGYIDVTIKTIFGSQTIEVPVFTISVDSSGNVTFTELRSVTEAQTNPTDAAENSVSFAKDLITLTQTITDGDGSKDSQGIDLGSQLSITDDGPKITLTGFEPTIILSESHLPDGTHPDAKDTSETVNFGTGLFGFGAVFADNFGADGAAKSGAVSYSLSIGNNGDSGLKDTLSNQEVMLVKNATTGEVDGVVTIHGVQTVVFSITVDSSGNVTFTLDRAVENNGSGPDGKSLASGALTLTQTITDGDGSTASNSIDLGSQLSIADDKPTVTANANGATDLTLSETHLTFFTNGISGSDPDYKLTQTSGDFSKAFTDNAGADGLASTTYALSIKGGNGTASGFVDSQTGLSDILFQNGNTITGFVGHTGIVAFTITLDPKTGEITFTEDRSVKQTQTGSDPSGDAASFTSGVVTLTQTITDGDGSTASASIDLGSKLSITDDGPSIKTIASLEPDLVVSESHLTSATNGVSGSEPDSFLTHTTGNFSFAFADTAGADGIKSVAYTLTAGSASGLVDSQSGATVTLVQVGSNEVEGVALVNGVEKTVFTVTVDASGEVTFTEDRAVEQKQDGHDPSHDLASLMAGAVTLTQTVTDNDGTTVSASLDISGQLSISDDGPSINVSSRNEPTIVVSEADLPSGTVHNGATSQTANFSGNFSDNFGADGQPTTGGVSYALTLAGPAPHSGNLVFSGLVDSQTGQKDYLVMNNGVIEGHVGSNTGALAFTISINPTSGVVTLTEYRAVAEAQDGNDPSNKLASLTDNVVFVTQTVTDNDGTSTSANLDIGQQLDFKDDGPIAPTVTADTTTIGVDEAVGVQKTNGPTDVSGSTNITFDGQSTTVAALFSGLTNHGTDTNVPSNSLDHGALSFAASGGSLVSVSTPVYGADGPAASGSEVYALKLESSVSGLKLTDGTSITLSMSNGMIIGTTGTDVHDSSLSHKVAFAIAIDSSNGDVYVAQYLSLNDNEQSVVTLASGSVGVTVTLTDGDGTTASNSADVSSQIKFYDDKPVAQADVLSGIDSGGAAATGANTPNVITGANETTAGGDTSGADGGLKVVGVELEPANYNPANPPTVLTGVDQQIVGAYGTLTLHADGSYSYVANPNTTNLSGTQTDTFIYTVEDADGSPSTTTLTINVNEVQPTVTVPSSLPNTFYEAGLPNGSGQGPTTTTAQGQLVMSEANGDSVHVESITFTLNGVTQTIDIPPGAPNVPPGEPGSGGGFALGLAHGEFKIYQDGTYSYRLESAENANSNGSETPDSVIVTVVDSHGNTTSTTLTFNIVDDSPLANAVTQSLVSGNAINEAQAQGLFGTVANGGAGDKMGADGPSGGNVTGVASVNEHSASVTVGTGPDGTSYTIHGEYGTLTLNQDGSYSYTANPNESGTDQFTYTLTDGDNSVSTNTLTFNVTAAQINAPAGGGTVYEAGLANGSQQGPTTTVTPSQTLTLSEADDDKVTVSSVLATAVVGASAVAISTDGVSEIINGAHGYLTINDNGTYFYTLTSPESANSNGSEAPDTFSVTVTDTHGNTTTTTLSFAIVDDVPVANEFTASVQQGASLTETTANGLFGSVTGDKIGADGPSASGDVTGVAAATAAATSSTAAVSGHVGQTVTDADGSTLVLGADGSFTFTASATAVVGSTDYFTYTITDGDGSTSTNTLAFTITAPPTLPLTVYESGLNGFYGTVYDGIYGTAAGSEPISSQQTFAIKNGDVAFFDNNQPNLVAPTGYHWAEAGGSWYLYNYQSGTVAVEVSISYQGGVPTIVETLLAPIDAHTSTGQYNLGTITVDAWNGFHLDGSESFQLVVADDSPIIGGITNAPASAFSDGSVTESWQPNFGADGQGSNPVNLSPESTPAATGNHVTISGHSYALYEVVDGSTTYYEATVPNGSGSTIYAFSDAQGQTPFFELQVSANGSYTFTSEQGAPSGTNVSLEQGGSANYLYLNNSGSLTGSSSQPSNQAPLWIQGFSGNTAEKLNSSNNGLGVGNNGLGDNETIKFHFANAQDDVQIGVGKSSGSTDFEEFQVTIYGSGGQHATETITLADGAPINIDAADWQGASGFLSGITEVDVTNLGTGKNGNGADSNLTLTSIDYATTPASAPGETLNFAVSITDGDGSTSPTQDFSVTTPGVSAPTITETGADLAYEAGLPGGSNSAQPSTVSTASVSVTQGSDPVNVTLAAGGLSQSAGITWVVSANGQEIDGYQTQNGQSVEVLSLALVAAAAGNYTIKETIDNALDNNGADANGDLGNLYVVATDANNPALTNYTSVQVGVVDDAPQISGGNGGSATVFDSSVLDVANATTTGGINYISGADGFATTAAAITSEPALTFNGQTVHYATSTDSSGDEVLTAYYGTNSSQNHIFTLTLTEPAANGAYSGTYTFDLLQQFPQTLSAATTDGYYSSSIEELKVSQSGAEIAAVSGSTSIGRYNNETLGEVLGVHHGSTYDFQSGDSMTFSFTNSPNVANFTFNGYSHSSDDFSFIVTYANGTQIEGSFNPENYTSSDWSSPLTGSAITSIMFTDDGGSDRGGVELVSTQTASSSDQALSFGITTTDGDGSTATGTINVNVDGLESSLQVNYGTSDSLLAPFDGSYHEVTDGGASSSNSPYTLIGDSSNDIFLAFNAGDTLQAHSATSGENIFEIANIGNPNELITNFNSSNDVIDLTQLLSNVNTSAPGFNINNYVEYNNSTGALEINTTGGGFGSGQNSHIETVATLDSTTQTGGAATHPQSPVSNPTILIAYQDQSHLVHSAHIHG